MPCGKQFPHSSTELTVASAEKWYQKDYGRRKKAVQGIKPASKGGVLPDHSMCTWYQKDRRRFRSLVITRLLNTNGRQAVNLRLLHLGTYHPRHCLFLGGLTLQIFQMSHQHREWFITWRFSKQNLFCFTKAKQNKRAFKQNWEGRTDGLQVGLRRK